MKDYNNNYNNRLSVYPYAQIIENYRKPRMILQSFSTHYIKNFKR